MLVEMGLSELLINAIANGRVRGIKLARNFEMYAAFEDLDKVIADKLRGSRDVAMQDARKEVLDSEWAKRHGWNQKGESDG